MLLIIDNYDSFTFNLVQALGTQIELTDIGFDMHVVRNDEWSLEQIVGQRPSAIIISPGPCSPAEAGVSNAVIEYSHGRLPILGVCLGHQCIASVFSGAIVQASRVVHGKTSLVHHNARGIFAGVESPFEAMRYHSLIVDHAAALPNFVVTAWTDDDVCMGIEHETLPTYGVQFHPESYGTSVGAQLLGNFLRLAFDYGEGIRRAETALKERDTKQP